MLLFRLKLQEILVICNFAYRYRQRVSLVKCTQRIEALFDLITNKIVLAEKNQQIIHKKRECIMVRLSLVRFFFT